MATGTAYLCLVSVSILAQPAPTPTGTPPESTDAVLALFNQRCVECHGAGKQSGKLRLDSLDAVFRGGRSGPPIVAGRSADSLLFERVIDENPKRRMPAKGERLDEKEVDLIRRWIDSGAKAPAASAAGDQGRRETAVTARAEALPAAFRPVFSLAGDPAANRFAVARGATIEVVELVDEPRKPGEKKDAKLAGRIVASLRGSSDIVQALAFSGDGRLLASGDFRVARVWDTSRWALLRVLEGHADRLLALAFSPDGKRLAAGGGLPTETGEVKVWDVDSGAELWSASPHSDCVYGLAWSRDGRTILTGSADRALHVLDAGTGKSRRRFEGHTHHILAVALSPDGKLAATAGADRALRLWNLEKGEYVRSLRGHEQAVTAVAFHGDGKLLASTGGDGSARFWEAGSGNQRFSLGETKEFLQSGCFFAGDKRYAAAEQDGPVRVYDVEKRQVLLTIAPK